MKKLYKALFILLIFTPNLAKAQRPSFKPSVHALVYGSQIDGDRFGGYDKANFALYLETERVNRKKLQWSLGIGFAQRGSFKKPDPENNIFTQYKVALNYLSVPLRLSTVKRIKNSKLQYYLSFGSEILTLVSATESDENGPLSNRADFRRITADAVLNLGLQQKEWTFYFTFRYSLLAARKLDRENGNYDSNLYQLNNVAGIGIKRNF